MQTTTTPRELITTDELMHAATDEGHYDPHLASIQEDFTDLFLFLGSIMPHIPPGIPREQFSLVFRKIEYLRLRVETHILPLPF